MYIGMYVNVLFGGLLCCVLGLPACVLLYIRKASVLLFVGDLFQRHWIANDFQILFYVVFKVCVDFWIEIIELLAKQTRKMLYFNETKIIFLLQSSQSNNF